jgi:hypothetical protein
MKALSNVQLTRVYVNQLKAALKKMEERAEKAECLALAMSSRFTIQDYESMPDEYRLHIGELLNQKYGG